MLKIWCVGKQMQRLEVDGLTFCSRPSYNLDFWYARHTTACTDPCYHSEVSVCCKSSIFHLNRDISCTDLLMPLIILKDYFMSNCFKMR